LSSKSQQREEQEFWERLEKSGAEVELKYARDLPDDAPEYILRMLSQFEKDVADFCFSGAKGMVLDAGCGNGNLLFRSLPCLQAQYVGMDFSRNMLQRAARRACSGKNASFLQGGIDSLPFKGQSFDRIVCSGVITCLPSIEDTRAALGEFYRVLKPDGALVVDFFNCRSHFTMVRRHLLKEKIMPPEYISPSAFKAELNNAGFDIQAYRGFDFKPYQGYLFMSSLRSIIDPCFVQERFSNFMESKVVPRLPQLSLLGYRIYVRCRKRSVSLF
jgi:SAM-dependent methyltransferase